MKFDTAVANIGAADLVLGSPSVNPFLYEWSLCHGHFHLKAATLYELLTLDGTAVVVGRKNAFCFIDISKYDASAGPSNGYDCGYQGITVGWQDIYNDNLDCQWIDVTGVPSGSYLLRVTVNQNGLITESDYSNNVTQAVVDIRSRKGRGRR